VEVARLSLSDQKVTGLDELRGDEERAVLPAPGSCSAECCFHAKRRFFAVRRARRVRGFAAPGFRGTG
jgi:hypothetical protein